MAVVEVVVEVDSAVIVEEEVVEEVDSVVTEVEEVVDEVEDEEVSVLIEEEDEVSVARFFTRQSLITFSS